MFLFTAFCSSSSLALSAQATDQPDCFESGDEAEEGPVMPPEDPVRRSPLQSFSCITHVPPVLCCKEPSAGKLQGMPRVEKKLMDGKHSFIFSFFFSSSPLPSRKADPIAVDNAASIAHPELDAKSAQKRFEGKTLDASGTGIDNAFLPAAVLLFIPDFWLLCSNVVFITRYRFFWAA